MLVWKGYKAMRINKLCQIAEKRSILKVVSEMSLEKNL